MKETKRKKGRKERKMTEGRRTEGKKRGRKDRLNFTKMKQERKIN